MSPGLPPFNPQESSPSCPEPGESNVSGIESCSSFKRIKSSAGFQLPDDLRSIPTVDASSGSSATCIGQPVSIITFNILAPIYKRIGTEGCLESQDHDAWFKRNVDIINMLLSKDSSIICLQEFWLDNEELTWLYEKNLGRTGYDTFKLARTREKGDGLLTAIKGDRIVVLKYKELLFNDYGDRVAQLFHLGVKVPLCKRNQTADQQLLLVNTHLLFPHDSNFCLVRLWQVHKIVECIDQFKSEHGLASVPVILCGDWNGSKRGHVYKFLRSQGFVSCYDSAHSYNDSDAHRWVSHRNHRGNICGVDFVWLQNPSNNVHSLSTSWREAVLGIFMAKIREAGLSWKEIIDCIKAKGVGSMLSLDDLQTGLNQCGVTGRRSESLISKEMRCLMQQSNVDVNKLLDDQINLEVVQPMAVGISNKDLLSFATFKNARVKEETSFGLAVADARLFPPQVEQGLWPEDYVLSDHAQLSVTLRANGGFDPM